MRSACCSARGLQTSGRTSMPAKLIALVRCGGASHQKVAPFVVTGSGEGEHHRMQARADAWYLKKD